MGVVASLDGHVAAVGENGEFEQMVGDSVLARVARDYACTAL